MLTIKTNKIVIYNDSIKNLSRIGIGSKDQGNPQKNKKFPNDSTKYIGGPIFEFLDKSMGDVTDVIVTAIS